MSGMSTSVHAMHANQISIYSMRGLKMGTLDVGIGLRWRGGRDSCLYAGGVTETPTAYAGGVTETPTAMLEG